MVTSDHRIHYYRPALLNTNRKNKEVQNNCQCITISRYIISRKFLEVSCFKSLVVSINSPHHSRPRLLKYLNMGRNIIDFRKPQHFMSKLTLNIIGIGVVDCLVVVVGGIGREVFRESLPVSGKA